MFTIHVLLREISPVMEPYSIFNGQKSEIRWTERSRKLIETLKETLFYFVQLEMWWLLCLNKNFPQILFSFFLETLQRNFPVKSLICVVEFPLSVST